MKTDFVKYWVSVIFSCLVGYFPQVASGAIAESERGLFKAYDFINSNAPREQRELVRKVVPSVIPLESMRASAFLVSLYGEGEAPVLVSAAHPLALEMDRVAKNQSRKVGGSLWLTQKETSPIVYPFHGLRDFLAVDAASGSGLARLLLVPSQSRTKLLERAMNASDDFSISQVVEPVEGQLAVTSPLEIAPRPPKPGEEIFLIAFPGVSREARKMAVSRGNLFSQSKAKQSLAAKGFEMPEDFSRLLYTDAMAIKGMSGGVALNRAGEVVGIIQGGYFAPELSIVEALQRGEITTQLVSIHEVRERHSRMLCSLRLVLGK